MAKKSKIVREHKLIEKVQKYAALRAELKSIIRSQESSSEDKQIAVARLDNLPKSSSHIRIRNRCFKTGRPRGVIKRFNLSRISFREMALRGEIPGVTKARKSSVHVSYPTAHPNSAVIFNVHAFGIIPLTRYFCCV